VLVEIMDFLSGPLREVAVKRKEEIRNILKQFQLIERRIYEKFVVRLRNLENDSPCPEYVNIDWGCVVFRVREERVVKASLIPEPLKLCSFCLGKWGRDMDSA